MIEQSLVWRLRRARRDGADKEQANQCVPEIHLKSPVPIPAVSSGSAANVDASPGTSRAAEAEPVSLRLEARPCPEGEVTADIVNTLKASACPFRKPQLRLYWRATESGHDPDAWRT
jgi:hypothetical protein